MHVIEICVFHDEIHKFNHLDVIENYKFSMNFNYKRSRFPLDYNPFNKNEKSKFMKK